MSSMARKKVTDFQPQRHNTNRHTQRGMSALEKSIEKDGWIGAMGAKAKKSLIEPVDPDGLDLDSLDFSGMGFDDLDFSILDGGEAIEDRRDSEELVQEAEESGEDVYALERSQRKLIKYLDFHYERIRNVEDLVDPPKLNEQYRLVTQKGFNTFTFILYLSPLNI